MPLMVSKNKTQVLVQRCSEDKLAHHSPVDQLNLKIALYA